MSSLSFEKFYVPVFKNDYEKQLHAFYSTLKHQLYGLLEGSLQANLKTSLEKVYGSDAIRVVAQIDVPHKSLAPIKNALLKMLIQAQFESSASAFIALSVFLEVSSSIYKAKKTGKYEAYQDYAIDKLLFQISQHSKAATLKDANSILKRITGDELAISLVTEAGNLGGLKGQVFIDPQSNISTHIELKAGYNFDCYLVPEYKWKNKSDCKWEASEVKCVIIDGIIESVSEIHHMLEKLNSLRQPAVLFARGFSMEVITTLSVNAMRGTLNVAPVVVGYTIEHANTLKDIAVACGGDVVSSLKGELISAIDLDEATTIEKVRITPAGVMISHKHSKQNVNNHVKKIQKNRQELLETPNAATIEKEKIKYLDKRIKALTANSVKIGLGKELGSSRGLVQDRLELSLRLISETARYGMIGTAHVGTESLRDERDPIRIGLKAAMDKINKSIPHVPVQSAMCGIKKGIIYATMLSNTGTLLIEQP